jgi:hypothetical protein
MENPFAALYQTYTDEKLVDIIRNRTDYQVPAIEAAEQELTKRNVDLNNLYNEETFYNETKVLKEKIEGISMQSLFLRAFDKLFLFFSNKIYTEPETMLRRLIMVIGGLAVYNAYKAFKLLGIVFDIGQSLGYSEIIFIFQALFLLIALRYLYLKMNWARIAIIIWSMLIALSLCITAFMRIFYDFPMIKGLYLRFYFLLLTDLVFILFYIAFAFYLSRAPIKKLFSPLKQ